MLESKEREAYGQLLGRGLLDAPGQDARIPN